MPFKRNLIFLAFAFVALFSLNTLALPLFTSKNLKMNAHAGSSGIIELQKDSNGFYVEADLNTYPFGSSKKSTDPPGALGLSDSVNMMVSLSNDETLVTVNCLNFSNYDCGKYNCHKEDWNTNISFPTFNASAQAAKSYIYLDYFFWGLETANLYIAQSCQTANDTDNNKTGLDRYGVLGLGTGNGSDSNYLTSQLFSVEIKSDLSGGKLLFMNDASTYANTSEPIYTLSTNSSWQVPISNASLQLGNSQVNLTADKLLFDLNADAIGLPFENYNQLELAFFESTNVYCNFGLTTTTCFFLKQVVELPDIILMINGNNLTIPSALYAKSFRKCDNYTCFTLNFKPIDTKFVSKSYVTPAFNNSIILDANFMSYYYTVFDATSGSNKIYLYQAHKTTPDDGDGMKALIGGTIAVIFIVGICYCASKKKQAEKSARESNDTTQAPLIYSSYNAQPQGGVYNGDGYQQPQGNTIRYGQN